VREVEAAYNRHSRTARELAEEYFDSRAILGRLVDQAMGPVSSMRREVVRR
jgi:hypothetical protein